jgi:HEAT repeat protein
VQYIGTMRIFDKSVAIALGYALKDDDDRVRTNALSGLQVLGTAAAPAVPQLIDALKDKDDNNRFRSALVLGRIGPAAKDAVPALTAALQDPNAKVRSQAQRALSLIEKK